MLCPLHIFLSILFFQKNEDQVKEPAPEPLNLTPLHSHLACEGRKSEVQGGRCFGAQASPSATPGLSDVPWATSGVAPLKRFDEHELELVAKPDKDRAA